MTAVIVFVLATAGASTLGWWLKRSPEQLDDEFDDQ